MRFYNDVIPYLKKITKELEKIGKISDRSQNDIELFKSKVKKYESSNFEEIKKLSRKDTDMLLTNFEIDIKLIGTHFEIARYPSTSLIRQMVNDACIVLRRIILMRSTYHNVPITLIDLGYDIDKLFIDLTEEANNNYENEKNYYEYKSDFTMNIRNKYYQIGELIDYLIKNKKSVQF